MPNHIINTIRLTGDREKISELLESVKDNKFGIGSLDLTKSFPCRKVCRLKRVPLWNED